MSQTLREARRYEETHGKEITGDMRPAIHMTPRVGWLNDPNGFSYYCGQYHLFYQYYPYDSYWGPMHWGHAISKDLLHWTYLPCALAPDRSYDRDGCFSGSALSLPDGRQMLMYTGIAKEHTGSGISDAVQTQNLAFGDGIDYIKYTGNPVLTSKDLPEGGHRYDFRDPKIWQSENGSYRAIAVDNHLGEGGRVSVYQSTDALHWKFKNVLIENHNRIGRMWECPDLFLLGNKDIFMASGMEMLPTPDEYHSGNSTFYMIGTVDDRGVFHPETDHAMDYGIDFYAAQTMLSPDGRRIMIAWMQNPDTCSLRTDTPVPWFGQMTMPRELTLRNGRIYQKPVRELEACRRNPVVCENISFQDSEIHIPGIKGRVIDLEVDVENADAENVYRKFTCRFASDGRFYTSLRFRPRESTLALDRGYSGVRKAFVNRQETKISSERGHFKFRLILDQRSAEIFVNDGEKTMTATLDTNPAADDISFIAEGKVKIRAVKYDLK